MTVIPPMDPFGIPAAAWVFTLLLTGTMYLHVLFMNFAVGGCVIATVLDSLTLLRRGNHDLTVRIIWQVVPVALSLTITTGVAPLLFVQLLYGQFFYTANVLMGFVWLAVVGLLILGFYLAYFISYRLGNVPAGRMGTWNRSPAKRLPISALCAVLFLSIAWVLTNNHMLSVQPDAWPQDGTWAQNRLIVTPALTVPRFLHNVGGILAVSGVWIAAIGWWRKRRGVDPPQIALRIIRTGLWITTPILILAAVGGTVMLFGLPQEVRSGLVASTGLLSILWWIALIGVVGQVVFAVAALRRPERFRHFAGLAGCMMLTLAGMLCGREQIRLSFLSRPGVAFELDDWTVHWQRSTIAIFVVVLVIGLLLIAWMVHVSVSAARHTTPSKEAEPKREDETTEEAG